jgi:hypothetical protein
VFHIVNLEYFTSLKILKAVGKALLHSAQRHSAENGTFGIMSEHCYAESRYAECRYSECRYSVCRYAEYRHANVANDAFMLSVVAP